MICPICDESFSSEELFSKHIESHKRNSILSSTPEESVSKPEMKPLQINHQLNLEKIFGKEKFENLISNKLKQIDDIDELVKRRVFAEQTKQIISKFPFFYMPYFIDDFMTGKNSSELLKKFHILNYMELKDIVENILKLNGYRHKLSQYENALFLNLKNHTWQEKYEIIKDNCNFFQNELLHLLFYNVLRSYIILIVSDYFESGIGREEIILKSKSLENNYDIFHFMNKSLKSFFNGFLKTNYKRTADDIMTDLIDEGVLRRKKNNLSLFIGPFSIDEIKQTVIDVLEINSGTLSERILRGNVTLKHPSLRLIPGLGLWNTALRELEHEKLIRIETKTNFRNDGLIFLNNNYQKIQQKLKQFDDLPIEFFGRKISPESFIIELNELEKGDLGDNDDQVTRIAGLVLAESVKVYSPREEIPDFDFSTNLENYHFRPEQLNAITKLNFKINSKIFHCKVMVDEILTVDKYNELKKKLPPQEQGVIITFKKVPKIVKEKISKDSAIQIIDEEGIKIWVSITSVIPSRKHAIAKLYLDPVSKLEKKIVKINYIDYENGLASVTLLPQMQEATVLIRSLEEIPLNEIHPKEFETLSTNYLKFLHLLSNLTKESDFVDGMYDQKIVDTHIGSSSKLAIKFEHHEVFLNLKRHNKNNILKCGCLKWVESPLYLCPHLVAGLDYCYRTFSYSRMDWEDDKNDMRKSLQTIIRDNISVTLERLGIEYDQKNKQVLGDKKIIDFVSEISKLKGSP